MSVNYASKYAAQVDERFSTGSLTNGLVNREYDWIGVSTVNVYSIPTSTMNDYSMSGTSRYGTPEELGNEAQAMTVKQDRSFTFTIDRKNYAENYINGNVMNYKVGYVIHYLPRRENRLGENIEARRNTYYNAEKACRARIQNILSDNHFV